MSARVGPAPAARAGLTSETRGFRGTLPPAAWLLLALGVALRVAQYARARSLWLDEAMLALNVAARPDLGLADRLDYAQSAAPLFLLTARSVTAVLGMNELALRFTPFVCSLLLLPAVWAIARRLVSRRGVALAVAVTALSPLLLRYATEFKPYASDALVATILALAALRLLAEPEARSRWFALQGLGVVALWLAIPSAFVLAGAGLSLFTERMRGRAGVTWRRLLATAAVWGVAASGVYVLALRRTAGDPFLRGYFEQTFFAPDAPNLVSRVVEGSLVLAQAFWHGGLLAPGTPVIRQLAIALSAASIAVGVAVTAKRFGPAIPALLTAPVVAAAAASAARAYPFTPRTLVFAVPFLIVLAAAGFEAVAQASKVGRLGAAATVALLVTSATVYDIGEVRHPTSAQDEARQIIQVTLRGEGRHDPVYISPYALPQWVFYSTHWDVPDRARLEKYRVAARSPDGPALQVRPTRGRPVREDEAEGLVYRTPERVEIIGLFDGQVAPPVPPAAPPGRWGHEPDSGWADLEARRLRAAANSCVWVLGPAVDSNGDLARSVRALGGHVEVGPGRPGVNRARVCFAA